MSKLTNEEAIHVLVLMKMAGGSAFENTITNDALDIAIRAIKEQKSKLNGDLISRHEALMELNGACSNWQDDATVAEIIQGLPSCHNCIECEPPAIVKCKECQHYGFGKCPMFNEYMAYDLHPDDYCSKAERKNK